MVPGMVPLCSPNTDSSVFASAWASQERHGSFHPSAGTGCWKFVCLRAGNAQGCATTIQVLIFLLLDFVQAGKDTTKGPSDGRPRRAKQINTYVPNASALVPGDGRHSLALKGISSLQWD